MSYLYIVSTVMFLVATGSYVVLRFVFEISAEIASGLAGFFILSIGPLRDALEASAIKYADRQERDVSIPTLAQFAIRPVRLLVVGALMFFASLQVSALLGGVAMGMFVSRTGIVDPQAVTVDSIGLFSLPIILLLAFWVSSWMSRSAKSHALLICVAAAVLGKAVAILFDMVAFRNIPEIGAFYAQNNPALLTVYAVATMLPAILLGWWRGRSMREAIYFKFLMDVLPSDAKTTICALALEEAEQSLNHKAQPA